MIRSSNLRKKQNKDTNKEQLKAFVSESKYIDITEQAHICSSFDLPYIASIFQNEYRKRFYDYLKENTTTVATVSRATGIPHKYLCHCKAHFEKIGLLKVVGLARCKTTGSANVQFVTTNLFEWNADNSIQFSDQLKLF